MPRAELTNRQCGKGDVSTQLKIDIGGGNAVASTVTVDAVEDLMVAKGSEVSAIIKAGEIIIGVKC